MGGGVLGVIALSMAFIAPWEGYSAKAYQDGAKVWTICRGHTNGVKPGMLATPQQCEDFFKSDVGQAVRQAAGAITVPVSDAELAAYTSFVFNVGIGKFRSSTMLRKINAGDRRGACNEFMRWVYVGGKDCRIRSSSCYGIVKRRVAERDLCLFELN
ncbi:lysozyme [Larkinella harenae]